MKKLATTIALIALTVAMIFAQQPVTLYTAPSKMAVSHVICKHNNFIYIQVSAKDQTDLSVPTNIFMVFDENKPQSSTNPVEITRNIARFQVKVIYDRVFFTDFKTDLFEYVETLPMSETNPRKLVNGSGYFSSKKDFTGSEFYAYDGDKIIFHNFAQEYFSYNINSGEIKEFFAKQSTKYWGQTGQYYSVEFNNKLYFSSSAYAGGVELYIYDKSKPMVQVPYYTGSEYINPSFININKQIYNESSRPQDFFMFKGNLYFHATDSNVFSLNLYKIDSANNMTLVIRDYVDASKETDKFFTTNPSDRAIINDVLYFPHSDAANGCELWMYDGVNAPRLCVDLQKGAGSSTPRLMTVLDGNVTFTATVDGVERKYAYDGKKLVEVYNFDQYTSYVDYRILLVTSTTGLRVNDGNFLYYTNTKESQMRGDENFTGCLYKIRLTPSVIDTNTTKVSVCEGTEAKLTTVVTGDDKTAKYEWYNDNGTVVSTSKVLNTTDSGSYKLVITNDFGSTSKNFTVDVNSLPVVDLNDTTLNTKDIVKINGTAGMAKYSWSTGGKVMTYNNFITIDPTKTTNGTTTYELTVTTDKGCSATGNVSVTNNYKPEVVIVVPPVTSTGEVLMTDGIESFEVYTVGGVYVGDNSNISGSVPSGIYIININMTSGDKMTQKVIVR